MMPKNHSKVQPVDSRVEWLAWSLQLLVGFVVGFGVGYQVWRLFFRSSLNEILLVEVGTGLICGAFTSFYGNRAWRARSIFLAPEPAPPRKARACSLVVGGAGAAVLLLTVVHHMIALATRKHDAPSASFHFLLFLAAAVPGFVIVHAIRTGAGFWRFGMIQREDTPLLFWVYVFLSAAAMLGMLFMAI